jgi:hypothetical protein
MEPPKIKFDFEKALMRKAFGRQPYAYWEFFNRDDAPAIMEKNVKLILRSSHS